MDLALLEKVLIEFAPPAAKNPILNVFKSLKTQPYPTSLNGLQNLLRHIREPDSVEAVAATNGIVTGVCIAYAFTCSEHTRKHLEDWLEFRAKSRGENVVDFFTGRK